MRVFIYAVNAHIFQKGKKWEVAIQALHAAYLAEDSDHMITHKNEFLGLFHLLFSLNT